LKLVIQIPCLDEESTLPTTLADLPHALPGVSSIETLVIDDGSEDRTCEVARAAGVTRVVRLSAHRGLASAFARGLDEALAMGADVIVNTDADNQYRGADIERLIAPILAGRADMVIGTRAIDAIAEFSPLKKWLQKFGSMAVRRLSSTHVPDATSGFRAYSRNAAMRLTVVTNFTYTLETLIQAGQKSLTIAHVPIRTNPKLRESRLFSNMGTYISRSVGTLARVYILYQPLRVMIGISSGFMLAAVVLFARAVYFYFRVGGQAGQSGHVQSLVLAAALAVIAVLVAILGILSDLTAMNRRLIEEVLTNSRLMRFGDDTVGARNISSPPRPAALPVIGPPRREAARNPETATGRSGRS
jgi:glycosyltransferase involved in cell wall biosynthesis